MVTISEKAASEIKGIMNQHGGAFQGVRVFVAGGGCSGLSYGMQIADEPATADDLVFEADGVKIIVDLGSHQHLDGASIDFDDSLQGGFKINNPNAVKSCGCGSSFATEETPEGAEAAKGGGCGCGGGGGCGSG